MNNSEGERSRFSQAFSQADQLAATANDADFGTRARAKAKIANALIAESLLSSALEAIEEHRDTLDDAALHGPKRHRDQVDNDLYNLARSIRSKLEKDTSDG